MLRMNQAYGQEWWRYQQFYRYLIIKYSTGWIKVWIVLKLQSCTMKISSIEVTWKKRTNFLLLFTDVQQHKKKTATWARSDNQMNTEQLSFQDQVSLGCPSWTPAQHLEGRTWDAGKQTQHLTFQSVASMLFETDARDLVLCFRCRSPHTEDKKKQIVWPGWDTLSLLWGWNIQ